MNEYDPGVAMMGYKPIGLIHSEHCRPEETPIQPIFARGCVGWVEIFPDFAEGLRDLEGFSHLHLIYNLHRVEGMKLTVKPFLQDVEHGIFATRFPHRPNPIGLSLVELIRREGNILHLQGLDILDGTPLLDIKPYVTRFDQAQNPREGWYEALNETETQSRGKRGYRGGSGPFQTNE